MATRTFNVTITVQDGDDMTIAAALDFWNASSGQPSTLEWVDDYEILD